MRSLPISVPLTQEEFNQLRRMQIKFRWDWPATFSANAHGHIWPFKTYSYTREFQRIQLRGASELLDYLADEYISIRPDGGRFFINAEGAYFRPEHSGPVQFTTFRFVTYAQASRRQALKPLGPGRTEEQLERHNDQVCDEERCPFCADERLREFGFEIEN